MDTLISVPTDGVMDRFEDLASDFGARVGRGVLPSCLTNRDVEAETLVRLARLGYDWSDTPREEQRAP